MDRFKLSMKMCSVPIVLVLISTTVSLAEPLDFTKHNDIPLSGSLSQQKDMPSLKLFKGIELEALNDFSNWNEPDGKYEDHSQNLRKVVSKNEIYGDSFDDIDETPGDLDDLELNQLSTYLSSLLRQPAWQTPLLIVEDPVDPDEIDEDLAEVRKHPIFKRSRYYRRYPWKRQNARSRNTYDYESSPHVCTPTREDVFQLLVALHDVRQGNKSRTVNFCNRRRPVGSVFTNIRFLGRRK